MRGAIQLTLGVIQFGAAVALVVLVVRGARYRDGPSAHLVAADRRRVRRAVWSGVPTPHPVWAERELDQARRGAYYGRPLAALFTLWLVGSTVNAVTATSALARWSAIAGIVALGIAAAGTFRGYRHARRYLAAVEQDHPDTAARGS
jgi:hypothetical protein